MRARGAEGWINRARARTRERERERERERDREKDGGCLAETQSCPANRIIINYDTVRARRKKKTRRGRGFSRH